MNTIMSFGDGDVMPGINSRKVMILPELYIALDGENESSLWHGNRCIVQRCKVPPEIWSLVKLAVITNREAIAEAAVRECLGHDGQGCPMPEIHAYRVEIASSIAQRILTGELTLSDAEGIAS